MQPYLIFSDIDGTLVNDQQQASPATIRGIHMLLDHGHQFYIATGRMYASAQLLANQIDPRIRLIASNGGIYDTPTGPIQAHFSSNVLKQIYQVTTAQNVSAFFFTDHQVLYTKELPNYFKASDKNRIASNNSDDYVHIQRIADLLKATDQIINAIVIEDRDFARLEPVKQLLKSHPGLEVSSSNPNNLELIPRGVSKATAIQAIQQQLQITPEYSIAFGDGLNDVPMFSVVKTGVAMGNALPNVKQQAAYTTSDNFSDGVIKFLNTFIKESLN